MGNFALVLVLLLGQAMKKLFLGKLREIEIEHLTDKVWGAAMDILLTMTIFRSEFNTVFITWFTILIFFKIFHWLAQGHPPNCGPLASQTKAWPFSRPKLVHATAGAGRSGQVRPV